MSTNGQGSWERSKYDSCNYKYDLQQSVAVNKYLMDPIKTKRCDDCRPPQPGYITSRGVSEQIPLVAVDSEMKNITRKYSRCPTNKYVPQCPFCGMSIEDSVMKACRSCQGKMRDLDACQVITEDTRLVNPPCTLRGTGWSQHVFQDLCLNPQDLERIIHPGEVGINYRMVAKDNHRPCIPKLIDQSHALPPQRELPGCPTIHSVCGSFTEPLNRYQRMINGLQPLNQ
jgi:hypothetical protein